MGIKKTLLAKIEEFAVRHAQSSLVNEVDSLQAVAAELDLHPSQLVVLSDLTVQLRTAAQAGLSCEKVVSLVLWRVTGWLKVTNCVVLAIDEPEHTPLPKTITQARRDAARSSVVASDDVCQSMGDRYSAREFYDSRRPMLKMYLDRTSRSRLVDFVVMRLVEQLAARLPAGKTVVIDGVDRRGDRRPHDSPRDPTVMFVGEEVDVCSLEEQRQPTGEADIKLVQWSDHVYDQARRRQSGTRPSQRCPVLGEARSVIVETNDTDAVCTHALLAAARYRDPAVFWKDDFHVVVAIYRASNIVRPSTKADKRGARGARPARGACAEAAEDTDRAEQAEAGAIARSIARSTVAALSRAPSKPTSWYAVVSGTQLSDTVVRYVFGDEVPTSSKMRVWACRMLAAGLAAIGCDFVDSFAGVTFDRAMAATKSVCEEHSFALAAMRQFDSASDEDVLSTVESVATLLSYAAAHADQRDPPYETVLHVVWTVAYWCANERPSHMFAWSSDRIDVASDVASDVTHDVGSFTPLSPS